MAFTSHITRLLYVFFAVLLFSYPSITLLIHGGASALLICAALISLIMLVCKYQVDLARTAIPLLKTICIAFAAPVIATLMSEVWHQKFQLSALDAPSRFLIVVPLFLMMTQLPSYVLKWADLSFAFGAIAALSVIWILPGDTPERLSSQFLNAIHFGDIALLLGVLSLLSLNWWHKDNSAIRILKCIGFITGITASILSGSRGGWLAIPILIPIILYARVGRKTSTYWITLLSSVILSSAILYLLSDSLQERIELIWTDLVAYTQGHQDTSIGIRLQLYRAAFILISEQPFLGLGTEGLAHGLERLVATGELTPIAADLGRGEMHNQLLAYMMHSGILGVLALLAIYFVPALFFWQHLRVSDIKTRRTALMGLVTVIAFSVFGLTVETFNLKMTVSFYVTLVAILAGITAHFMITYRR
jgi:O-antigen ligase